MPLPKGGRLGTNIDGDIVDLTADNPNQLSLGILALKVKPPMHSRARATVIFLHQSDSSMTGIHQGFFKTGGSKALHKIAPGIAEDFGRKQYQTG
ncbi:hypothetical protein TUM17383_14640 [Shewanella algae]|nr:hypothetical protein TUM17383_14640 [Shewanella algae]